jgi:hypothetical protein
MMPALFSSASWARNVADVVFVDHSASTNFCAFKQECYGPMAFIRPERSGFLNSSVDDDSRRPKSNWGGAEALSER